jgi:hypothetical protein
MGSKSITPQYIIVLGTTYSGSGAIFDYLAKRGDLHDPLNGQEYQLPQVPHGLMELESAAGKAFHPAISTVALNNFEHTVKKLARSSKILSYGKAYNDSMPFFESSVKEFVNEICAANFVMQLDWFKFNENPIKYIFNKILNRIGFNEIISETRILVSREKLIKAAQKLHDKIFKQNSGNLPILLNQAGSGWNSVESTKYFLNHKVLVVTRDPRDQFAEIKKFKKVQSVEGFINWFIEMQSRLNTINNSDILQISFENFVLKNNLMVNLLCSHLSIPKNVCSNYEPNLSKKNIGIYKNILNQKEIKIIESNLSKFFFD